MRVTRKQRRARQRREEVKHSVKSFLSRSAGIAAAALIAWRGTAPNEVFAMPTGGEVAAGSAVINQAGKVMTIQQQTMQAILNWRAFGIAPDEHVKFIQPGSGAVVLNRVLGNDPSAIFGKLTANGHVFLVNPNGVFFAPGAQVNVGGMTATTLSITDADFMKKNLRFTNDGNAKSVVNQGSIAAANGGMVNLLAPEVANEGVIFAKQGTVNLAAGDKATLDFTGDGKVSLAVDPGAIKAQVVNKGLIEADGGVVAMTARANQELTSAVVNQSGIVRAAGFGGQAGAVVLDAGQGTVLVSGTIETAGQNAKGGTIDVFGKVIELTGTAKIDASGDLGGGKIRVGGDWQGTGDAPHADTVTIAKGAALHADANQKGNGGTVAVWSDGTTKFSGDITAKGGALGGDGGKVETSGHVLMVDGNVNAAAEKGKAGEWLLDPYNVEIKNDSSGDPVNGNPYEPSKSGSIVNVNSLNTALNNGSNITITTIGAGNDLGNITVTDAIAATGNATLTLQADGNIFVNSNITSAPGGSLNVDLFSDADGIGGGKIDIASGSTISTGGGWVKLRGGTDGYANDIGNNGTGANIAGSIQAGTGDISILGQSSGKGINVSGTIAGKNVTLQGSSTGVGIAFDAAANIIADKLVLVGDSMVFSNNSPITGTNLEIRTLTRGKSIGIGTSASGSLQIADLSKFSGFTTAKIGNETTGDITVTSASFTNDLELQTGGAITVSGGLTAKNLMLNTKNGISGTGVITADTLDLESQNVSLSNTQQIGALIGNVNQLSLQNGKDLTVGTVTKGLNIKADSTLAAANKRIIVANTISGAGLTLTANAIDLNAKIDSKNKNVNLTAMGGAINFGSSGAIAAGSGTVMLKAASLGTLNASSGAVEGNTLKIDNSTSNNGVTIGSGSGLSIAASAFQSGGAFSSNFGDIIIGDAGNTGAISINEALTANGNLTVNGGAITFGNSGALKTNGKKNLTVNGSSIAFTSTSGQSNAIAANGGTVILTTDAIVNWGQAGFTDNTGGSLTIQQKSDNQPLTVGGNTESSSHLSVTNTGLGKISTGQFSDVQIGKTGSGAVSIDTITKTPDKLTIMGGSGKIVANAQIENASGQTLTLSLSELIQNTGSVLKLAGGLLLDGNGSGVFDLSKGNNKNISKLAANVGTLKLSSEAFGIDTVNSINGIKTTGNIDIVTDQIDAVKQQLSSTGGIITIQEKTGTEGIVVNAAGSGSSGQLLLKSEWLSKISGGQGITLGGKNYSGSITVGDEGKTTTFLSKLNLWTAQNSGNSVNLLGTVNVGNASPWKDLYIHTHTATLPSTGVLNVANLSLEVAGGLGGFASGSIINGTGDLSVSGPTTGNIYISDAVHANDYVISYGFLNNVIQGFKGFEVKGTNDIIMEDGELQKSIKLTGTEGTSAIQIAGNVKIDGSDSKVTISGKEFTVKDNKEFELIGGKVDISADLTNFGTNSQVKVGSGDLTLTTNTLTAATGAKVDGSQGNLTIRQKSDIGLTIGKATNVSGVNGLVITEEQLNGALFGKGFKNLTLGNDDKNQAINIKDGVTINNNNVTIQTGGGNGGTISVTGGNLAVDGSVTLRGNQITNKDGGSNHEIDTGSGKPENTIKFYANTLELGGTGTVKGDGTLGIGTYDGRTKIYVGNGFGSEVSGLKINNSYFNGRAFANTFSSYSIGSTDQENIHIKDSMLTKNLILTGKDIRIEGDLALAGKDLTIRAGTYAGQHDGTIDSTSDAPQNLSNNTIIANNLKLEGQGAKFNLNSTTNQIGGVSGEGQRVNIASKALTVGHIKTYGGDLILSADSMNFDSASLTTSDGKGLLTLQQLSNNRPLQIGGSDPNPGSGALYLPGRIFNATVGNFNDGVYIGLLDGTAKVTASGDLSFKNNTYIRAAGVGGVVDVAGGAKIDTNDKNFTVQASDFTTGDHSSISAGEGNLKLSVDQMNLSGTSAITSDGTWTLETWRKEQQEDYWIYLGGNGPGPGKGLWIKKSYFNVTEGNNPVFRPGETSVIHFGNVDAKGKMLQQETIAFKNQIVIDQGKNGGLGFEIAQGADISTGGKDYSVNSQKAKFNHVTVDAGAGKIAINADYFTINGSKFIGSGITLDTYTKNQEITFGTAGENQAGVLDKMWFTGETFANAGPITIGSAEHTGGIKLTGTLETDYGLSLVTKGQITSDATANWNFKTNNLHMEGSKIEVKNGKLTNIGTLTATSDGSINIDNAGHTISKLGNITGAGVSIKDNGGLTIQGTVTSTGSTNNVEIGTKDGNLTIDTAGKVVSGKDAYLTAENAHFVNKNTGAAKDVLNTGSTGRWVIFTEDSLGDTYGNLHGNFRRYDTEYGDTSKLNKSQPTDYSGSGSAHKKNPIAKLSAEKVYGESYLSFFNNGSLKLVIEGGEERIKADQDFLGITDDLLKDVTSSSSYTLGDFFTNSDGEKMDVNKNIHGDHNNNGASYGTQNTESDKKANYKADKNPLNYNVQTDFWVTPKTLTITAKDLLNVIYSGQYCKPTDFTFAGWAKNENENNVDIKNLNTLSYLYGNSAGGQRNVGEYQIDINGSLTADNYVFDYKPGKLTITPKSITINVSDAWRYYGQDNNAVKATGTATDLITGDKITGITVGVDSSVGQYADVKTDGSKYTGVITVNGYTIDDGNNGKNYTVSYGNGDLAIKKRPVYISIDDKNRLYGNSNSNFTFTTHGSDDASGLVNNGATIGGIILNASAGLASNIGDYDITANLDGMVINGGSLNNYDIQYKGGKSTGTLTVNKRPLEITVADFWRIYGNSNDTLALITGNKNFSAEQGETDGNSGLVNGDTVTNITLNVAGIDKTTNASTTLYNNTIQGSNAVFNKNAGNYDITFVNGGARIDKRKITITVEDLARIYGAANPTVGSPIIGGMGLANDDAITGIDVTVNSKATDNVGDYIGAVSIGGVHFNSDEIAGNYEVNRQNGNLKVTKRKLVITPEDFKRIYGELDPSKIGDLTFIVSGNDSADSGLVNGDAVGGLNEFNINNPNGVKADVGRYDNVITMTNAWFSNGDINNYDVSYGASDLIVTPRDVYITAGDISRIYGKYNPSLVGHYTIAQGGGGTGTGLVNGDTISSAIVNYADFINALTNVGEYKGGITAKDAQFGSGNAKNYTVHYNPGTMRITPRPVLITAGSNERYYGDINPKLLAFLQETGQIGGDRGFINGDRVTDITQTYDPSMNQYTNAGIYEGVTNASNPIFAPDVNPNNYTIEYAPGTLTIKKAHLTITADDKFRLQGSPNPKFTVSYDGLKNDEKGEAVVTDLLAATKAEQSSPAGKYDIMPNSGTALNYEIEYVNGALTVTPSKNPELDAAKDVSKPKPADPTMPTIPSANVSAPAGPQVQPEPSAAPPVALPPTVVPDGIVVDAVINTNGSSSKNTTFVTENGGFALKLGGTDDPYDPARSHISGAIPVLYADTQEQKLDGIYTINYNPDKLAILPAAQGVTIPHLDEVMTDTEQGFSIVYKNSSTGSFDVAFGNGIVSIHSLDEKAISTVMDKNKEAARAVLATGVLTAVQDLGIMPDQMRAIYIFKVLESK